MLDRTILGLCLSAALVTALAAQDLPKTQIKVIGLNSPTPVSIYDEVPFWRKTIPEASKGAVSADITPLDQMSIDDKTMLRLLKLGVMDFAGMDISKMAGDDPRFEACDLAGLTLDPDKARAACNAYRDVIDRQMQKNWNAKLLAEATHHLTTPEHLPRVASEGWAYSAAGQLLLNRPIAPRANDGAVD